MTETVVYATDIHGDMEFYEKLFKQAKEAKIKYIIIGGDITPLEFLNSPQGLQHQRDFLELKLIPIIKKFRDETGAEIFIIMGNDDYSINTDILERAHIEGILKFIHNRICQIGKRSILGYSFINTTPFMFKEWEKTEEELKTDLMNICKDTNTENMIFSMHAPPFNTKLDVLYDGRHVGSTGIREFIEDKQPYITLHGHIHESPDMSGQFRDKIGKTCIVNPGDKKMLVFDLDNPEDMKLL